MLSETRHPRYVWYARPAEKSAGHVRHVFARTLRDDDDDAAADDDDDLFVSALETRRARFRNFFFFFLSRVISIIFVGKKSVLHSLRGDLRRERNSRMKFEKTLRINSTQCNVREVQRLRLRAHTNLLMRTIIIVCLSRVMRCKTLL